MAWVEKHQPTPFDELPLHGLFFLDGDLLARRSGRNWTAGEKLPMIAFPSGLQCQLWESSHPQVGGIVHIFGEIDLPFKDIRDRAFEQACEIAEACGYVARKVGENALEVYGHDDDENYLIIYDSELGQMKDVVAITSSLNLVTIGVIGSTDNDLQRPDRPLRMELLPADLRRQLPPLYSNERQGLEAVAPVKLFTPDSNWTWYASEFDGEDIFFGLVIGFEIELGSFSLSELESTTGPLGLPIERDKYYEPKTLRELMEQHRRERGE